MGRYSVIGSTVEKIESVGGRDIRHAEYSGVTFAELTEEQAEALRKQGCTVTPVSKVRAAVTPPTPVESTPKYTPTEFIRLLGYDEFRDTWDPPLFGAGTNIAILDTGIRKTHKLVGDRVVHSKNYTSSPAGDGFNHGTAVASMVVAVAPECGILDLKVLGDNGEGDEESVVMAIEDCIAMRVNGSEYSPHVINLSLGSPDDGNRNNPIKAACRAAIDLDIWVGAAAGNSGPYAGSVMSPACEKYVFAVGCVKYLPERRSFVVSDFSSRGPTLEGITKPDAVAFGEDLVLASNASDTATVSKSGTSFSTPLMSGAALLYIEGVARKARPRAGYEAEVEFGGLPASEFYYVPARTVLDQYLQLISIKPAGVQMAKDNDYGYGIVFGPLLLKGVTAGAGIGVGVDISSMLPYLIMLPMVGMMMKMTTRGR